MKPRPLRQAGADGGRLQDGIRRRWPDCDGRRAQPRRVEPMLSPRTGSPRRPNRRRLSLLAGAAVLGLVPATGCQVEYAGMTLPSGKYMRDDVQYYAPGPDFPWANTQAATQRARMAAMGMVPPP